MGPMEAGAVVGYIEHINALIGSFDRGLTLGEIEEYLYDQIYSIKSCPSCRGLGYFGIEAICPRCCGSGFVYIDE